MLDRDLQSFLAERIESHEQLRILFFLWVRSDHKWSCAEVAESLNISSDTASHGMAHLRREKLLTGHDDGRGLLYEYRPADSGLDEQVERLAQTYDEDLAGVVELLSVNALTRIRLAALRMFASAFVWRRNDE